MRTVSIAVLLLALSAASSSAQQELSQTAVRAALERLKAAQARLDEQTVVAKMKAEKAALERLRAAAVRLKAAK